MWNGFKARLDYSFNPYGDEGRYDATNSDYNKGHLWGATFNYDNGPLSLFLSYVASKNEGRDGVSANAKIGTMAGNDWSGIKGGAKYNLALGGGTLQLAAIIDQSKMKNVTISATNSFLLGTPAMTDETLKRTSWLLPVKYITGPHTFSLSYAQAGKTSNVADSKAKMYNLGYQYALSKRSYVGMNYGEVRNDDGAAYQIPLSGALTGSALAYGEKARVFSATFAHLF